MGSSQIFRGVIIILLFISATTASAFCTRTSDWAEDVLLRDGRVIKIDREVCSTFQFVSGDEGSMKLFASWPDKYWIKFEHPDTHETIKWQGEQYFDPALLDFVEGVPYLVVRGRPDKSTEKIYGCPELPYIYLKFEKNGLWGKKWTPIPVELAPDILRDANLSQGNVGVSKMGHSSLSLHDVQMSIKKIEYSSAGYFQAKIPRNYDDWHIHYKNSYRNERGVWDCRPPPKPLPDISIPKPVDVELELIESNDYSVESAVETFKTLQKWKGPIAAVNCSTLFRPADPENLMLAERFVNDQTGSKRLPYSGPTPFPSGRMLENRAERYCDTMSVWFVAGHEEVGNTIITKYTNAGDLLYNIRVVDPKIAGNKLARGMVPHSITVENGYFNFYWEQDITQSNNRTMERISKYRFREPMQKPPLK